MALTSTKHGSAVRFKVVVDSAVTSAAIAPNVTGNPGRLFAVRVDNSKDASNAVYVKIYDTLAPTLGTTYPCLVLKVAAASTTTFQAPYGLEYDSLSVSVTGVANPIGTGNPQSSTGIHLTCS